MSKLSIVKEFLVIFKSPQKMVAGTDYHFSVSVRCVDNFHRGFSSGSLYLHAILTLMTS